MNYETMDWEAEAKQLAKAFGVRGNCEFVDTRYGKDFIDIATGKKAEIIDGIVATAGYSPFNRFYTIRSRGSWTVIQVSWLDKVQSQHVSGIEFELTALVRALFYLDLLTSEVEAALQLSVSHHQKLEWTVEFENR